MRRPRRWPNHAERNVQFASRGERRPRRSRSPSDWASRTWTSASFRVDADLFRSIPVEWMLRYNFVPESRPTRDDDHLRRSDGRRAARRARAPRRPAAPGQGRQPRADAATSSRRASPPSASSTRRPKTSGCSSSRRTRRARRSSRSTRSRPTLSPIIKLVDSVRLQRDPAPRVRHPHRDAGERRHHQVPHRRRPLPGDGSDRQAHHARSSRASRSCPSSTSPRSAFPQDGRFKLRVQGADDRLPRLDHADGPRRGRVIRILDKESANAEFKNLNLDVLGFDPGR